jgi:Ca-activated chloride channel homolog
MMFAHPWFLSLAIAPLAWAAWHWRTASRRPALVLKAIALSLVAVALARPSMEIERNQVAVVTLADTSASITRDDLAAESNTAAELDRASGSNWFRVAPFARSTRELKPEEHAHGEWHLGRTTGAEGMATDFESAIRDGAASMPSGMIPRLLLLSDGNENAGSVERGIWQARQLGIPIDVVPLKGRPRVGLRILSVTLPGIVFSGEKFPIEVVVDAPSTARASVNLTAEGKTIGSSQVDLTPGPNRISLQASVNSSGAISLAGSIEAPGAGEAEFEQAVTLRRPRALFVSADPESSERRFTGMLESNQFEVTRSREGIPAKLEDYQLIVINNWDLHSLPEPQKAQLEQFVKLGGGLLWIAGERNVYVSSSKPEDPLQRTLPARLVQPRSTEGVAVVLIIDKSASMEGRKMDLAKRAAVGVVENLRPIDYAGILVFDNSFSWAAPVMPVADRVAIEQLISGIIPDGGTQIAPALAEAYKRILPVNAPYKHIVLLTDGISEEGDIEQTARQASARNITISTVGLGQDVNSGLLEKIARTANGRAYSLDDPDALEQILLRDVEQHTGSTAIETRIVPKARERAAILDGAGFDSVPALKGYVRFTSKPASDVVIEAQRGDPLFVRWQYGLGKSSVFTSDAKNRWAASWMNWPGYDRLWANIVRDLLPHAPLAEATASFDSAGRQLVVDYRLARDAGASPPPPDIYVFGPGNFRAQLRLSKAAEGLYRGRVAIGEEDGLYRVRPLAESRAFPEVGYYRQQEELRDFGRNDQLLHEIAEGTGGRYEPTAAAVFDPGGRGVRTSMSFWPLCLALSILLNLVELILRKAKGVLGAFRRGSEPAGAPVPSA